MNLNDKLLNIINTENKKNPISDIKLSKMLSTSRECITILRKELNIGNSRERRKPYLENYIKTIIEKNSTINVTDITKQLKSYGFDISRHVIESILNDTKIGNKEVSQKEKIGSVRFESVRSERDPFESLIGYDGSLKNNILQSKSAILYPPHGLATMICGESGVGKTQFAECMYNFAKEKTGMPGNMPFIVFNCADYSDNPQLLLSLLYGSKKGSFTGADSDTVGIVEHANNGILFLDEIHRLPPKGQEILFSILDKGKFRRLGETYAEREVNVMFIGATTENIESSMLLTFRRRIPMIISIPPLYKRPFTEKIQLIYFFFQQECNRINSKIYIESKVTDILTLSRFNGNIGELKSKIQVICARAFMKKINRNDDIITIDNNEVMETNVLEKDLLIEDLSIGEIRDYTKDMLLIPFINEKVGILKNVDNSSYSIPKDFYNQIENKYSQLKNLDMNPSEIEEILWTFIINKFDKMEISINNKDKFFSLNKLGNLIDVEIIELVKNLRVELKDVYSGHDLNENVFNYMAIHLEETIKRIRLKQSIINVNLPKIKKDFSKEYEIAIRFTKLLEKEKGISIPEDEIGFIAMYINASINNKSEQNKVGVILLSHGKIATETINVVKQLLNVNFPVALDMPLDENPSSVYEKAIEISKIIDNGKGILFLVDMGSLINIGEIVANRLGIATRTIDRVDLLTVIEAVSKISIAEASLDEIYLSLIKTRYSYPLLNITKSDKPKAIISLCLTGEGTACHIKEFLEKKYKGIKILKLGVIDEEITTKIKKFQEKYNIIAIVGTINPEIEDITFIPYNPQLLSNGISYLDLMLNKEHPGDFENTIEDDLILFEPDVSNKKDLIEVMCSMLINKGYVKKEFFKSVFNREDIVPTFLKGGIAIPHGEHSFVLKSSFVIVKLKNPIDWGIGKVDIVCLVALKINDKNFVKEFLKLLLNMDFIKELKSAVSVMDLKDIILSNTKEASI
ncbi:sigma 54-interacting transcriptional regulator [Clostridium lacusfryxellense]|uniref:sigma 54-interacting transcriptional regulator n=1 Tax=Clostridium lacusfryxellense TaxID=205328 RepID=UPI001C0D9D36|nr:sigma 54-interacting transcriptional regulator [Clostridium lacusfryxellense]MBU3114271.1 sigma 54-interacting transcriptional regulator [Clostridium lacusfryxellense]